MGASNRVTVYDGLLGVGLLGLALFAWLPDSYFRMVSWPWVMVWQIALLLLMGGCLWQLRRFDQPFYRLGFGFDWLILALLLCLMISSAIASFPILALQNSLLVGCYVIVIYGLRNSRFSPWQLCQGLVWVGAIAAVVSLSLWRPTPDMWLSDNFHDAIRNRFPMGHHNFTGGYFVLVLPMAAGMTRLQSGWRRWLYGLFSLVITAALYASGSRGAWLGAMVLMVITLGLIIARSRGKARLGAIFLSSLVICAALGVLATNPRMRSLLPRWQGANTAVVTDGPARDRLFMGQAALNIIKDRPLGLGPGNLGRVYERYRPLAAGAGLTQVQQLHNTPLQIVVELGLAGAIVYLGAVGCVLRLVLLLQALPSKDRQLSLVTGLGFVGYGISSLSDYQLENIPIAITLSVMLVVLIQLGASLKPVVISQAARRWGSLLILTVVAIVFQFWLRLDLAMWMTHQGLTLIQRGELSQSDDKFYTAAKLAPWDPTSGALGAQQLSELAQTAVGENQTILREEAINLYQQTLKAAPNDIWFNQNLAVLAWQLGDTATAQSALTRVVQLNPRSQNHSYYLLGLTYQDMGDTNAAVEALALECLLNPTVLTFESWQQELAPIKDAVFSRVLQHYQTMLLALEANHPLHQSLESTAAALRWWAAADSQFVINDDYRPLLQALFTLETSPEQATTLLDSCMVNSPADAPECRLLKAWLEPDYLDDYLNTSDLDPAEQERVRSHITTHRTLKDWLRSTTQAVPNNQRVALALLYRSYYAQRISSILIPEDWRQFSLPISLDLFSLAWPREFPPLDDLVETVRTESLGLPHPTRNNFQFSLSSAP